MHLRFSRSIAAAVVLSGCAGLQDYQASCEQKHQSFPAFAACYKAEVLADRRANGDPHVKLLLLKTDQIAERVKAGQLSDLDARVEFQQAFVGIREGAMSENAQRRAAANTTTNCVMRGNKMACSPY